MILIENQTYNMAELKVAIDNNEIENAANCDPSWGEGSLAEQAKNFGKICSQMILFLDSKDLRFKSCYATIDETKNASMPLKSFWLLRVYSRMYDVKKWIREQAVNMLATAMYFLNKLGLYND